MTEKEKAKELMQRFQSFILDEDLFPNTHLPTLTDSEAKKAAIICVDEIIELNPPKKRIKILRITHWNNLEYWQKVKAEINKL